MRPCRVAPALLLIAAGCGPQADDGLALDRAARNARVAGAVEEVTSVVTRRLGSFSASLWGAGDNLTGVSPDGRRLLYVDWESGGNMATVDLGTGEHRTVTRFDDQAGWMEGLFSPDGNGIVFVRRSAPRYVDGSRITPPTELRITGLDGGSGRLFLTAPAMYVMDVALDGTRVAVDLRSESDDARLAVVSTIDGSVEIARSFDGDGFQDARFSPDGRWLAYLRRPGEDEPGRDLYVVAAHGGRETRITEAGGRKSVLGWTAGDGALLYATRTEDGSARVWRLPMADGRSAGPAELVRTDLWGFSAGRIVGDALYYTVGGPNRQVRIYEAGVDLEGLHSATPPAPLSRPDARPARSGSWSPDGGRVAYVLGSSPATLVVRSLATGDERDLVPGFERMSVEGWRDDGRSLVLRATREGASGLFAYDLDTGALSRMADTGDLWGAVLSPDGSRLYALRDGQELFRTIVAKDLASGTETVVADSLPQAAKRLALSPDGRLIAVELGQMGEQASLVVVPTDGGAPTIVFRDDPPTLRLNGSAVAWSPDGERLVFSVRHPDPAAPAGMDPVLGRQSLMAVPAAGGPARRLLDVEGMSRFVLDIAVHPDGRRVLFHTGMSTDEVGELWVMENLSPAEERPDAGEH